MVISNIDKWLYRVYMYKPLFVNVSVSLIVSGVQPHMTHINFSKLISLIKTKIIRQVNIKLSQLISTSICRSKIMYLAWILIFCFIETWAVLNNPLTPQIVDEQWDQMSIPPPENTADWVHPVIFEPMKAICLTQSTFKVTTYIDFVSHLETFQMEHNYLQDF